VKHETLGMKQESVGNPLDLRAWLREVEALGELKEVRGADWNLEIGAITEISGSEPNPPALLFDDIQDYPPGFRIFTNMFQTQSRTALALGLPKELRGVALVQAVRKMLKDVSPMPPVFQETGPLQENFLVGKEASVLRFPAPKLHREDGGRYLGTADAVWQARAALRGFHGTVLVLYADAPLLRPETLIRARFVAAAASAALSCASRKRSRPARCSCPFTTPRPMPIRSRRARSIRSHASRTTSRPPCGSSAAEDPHEAPCRRRQRDGRDGVPR